MKITPVDARGLYAGGDMSAANISISWVSRFGKQIWWCLLSRLIANQFYHEWTQSNTSIVSLIYSLILGIGCMVTTSNAKRQ